MERCGRVSCLDVQPKSRLVFERAVAACYRAIDFRRRGRYFNTMNVRIIRWFHSEDCAQGMDRAGGGNSEEFALSQT
jgi:hypothetical protein